MKKTLIILMSAVLIACRLDSGNVSLSTTSNGQRTTFTASFPKAKMGDVIAYIEDELDDENIFQSDDDYRDVEMRGKHNFHLKATKGFVKVTFDKNKNNEQAFKRLQAMCKGFGKALK